MSHEATSNYTHAARRRSALYERAHARYVVPGHLFTLAALDNALLRDPQRDRVQTYSGIRLVRDQKPARTSDWKQRVFSAGK